MSEQTMTVVSLKPVVTWAWRFAHLFHDKRRPVPCHYCGRIVAAPTGARLLCCLYCGFDRGFLSAVDKPFDEGVRDA